ncbi:aspartate kinase, partial [Odoribacter splanchnicus]|nr:aspartate kinase [Odoribacter splanchnicus]
NLMQNSAITLSFFIDYTEAIFVSFIDELHDEYEVLYNINVRLLTIRHYNEDIILQLTSHKNVLVEQRSRLT